MCKHVQESESPCWSTLDSILQRLKILHSIFQPAALICQRTTAPWLLAWVSPGYRRMRQNRQKLSKIQSHDGCNKSNGTGSPTLSSCSNPWHLATSAAAFSFFGAATGGTAASPTSGAEKTWFVCVLGVSGVPLPILVASSLYLVFTLKRLQTVIRLIRPACYFSASGCFGVLAKCPGFGIFRQTQHFGLQKKKDSNINTAKLPLVRVVIAQMALPCAPNMVHK